MKWGSSKFGGKVYKAFARAIRQAMAQARAKAEVEAFQNRPLDWLRSGPGKEVDDIPGWTANVKHNGRGNPTDSLTLDHPLLQILIRFLLNHLEPWPEVRATIAKTIETGALDTMFHQQAPASEEAEDE